MGGRGRGQEGRARVHEAFEVKKNKMAEKLRCLLLRQQKIYTYIYIYVYIYDVITSPGKEKRAGTYYSFRKPFLRNSETGEWTGDRHAERAQGF